MELIRLFIFDPNSMWILLGCSLLGVCSGIVGSWAYLRKQTLIGDALAHSTLPGVCLAFMVTGTKSLLFFLIGAAISSAIAMMCIRIITHKTKIKQDSAMGIVLSVFFGFGIVCMTWIQKTGHGNQSGLDTFLFGRSASMLLQDIYLMTGVCIIVILICVVFFKEFTLFCFDEKYARSQGFSPTIINFLLMGLIILTVISGIQAVGVVLIVSLLITPAVSARYWTNRIHHMIILAGLFGGLSGMVGTWISTWSENLPTGALCVLASFAIFLCSALFSPKRGVIYTFLLTHVMKKRSQSIS